MGFTIQTPQESAMAPLVAAVALGGAHLDQLCRACAEQQDKRQQDWTARTRLGQQESQIQQDSRTADSKTPGQQNRQENRTAQEHKSSIGMSNIARQQDQHKNQQQQKSKKLGAKSIQ